MGVKELADKYIGRRGGRPKPEPRAIMKPRPSGEKVTLTSDEYRRLLAASELDDMIARCDQCGAWMDKDEPAYFASDEDFVSCCKYATGKGACVSHRAIREKD